jgi:hypothetical protein
MAVGVVVGSMQVKLKRLMQPHGKLPQTGSHAAKALAYAKTSGPRKVATSVRFLHQRRDTLGFSSFD